MDIVTLAETYSLNQLRKRVYRFISGHLLEFAHNHVRGEMNFQILIPSNHGYIFFYVFNRTSIHGSNS